MKTRALGRRGINLWPYWFSLPFLLCYLAFHLYPVIYSFFLSFYDWNGIGEKTFVGLKNYADLWFRDPLFGKSIRNTIIIMLLALPVTFVLGLALANITFNMLKGKRFFQTVNFLPYITTPVAIGFIFSYMFDWQTGIINQIAVNLGLLDEGYYWLQVPFSAQCIVALMFIWKHFGYFMTIYLAGMTAIPQELYEAAKIDGAKGFDMFFRITMPLLRNITVFLVITSIISGLQLFDEPKLLYGGWGGSTVVAAGGPENAVLTVIWKFVDNSFVSDNRLGYGSAVAYSLFLLIALFSIVSYRLTSGRRNDA